MAKSISEGQWIAIFLLVLIIGFFALDITGNIPWNQIQPGTVWWTLEVYIITFGITLLIMYSAWFVFKRIYKYFK